MVGVHGYDPCRLQRSAAPVYKTEPHPVLTPKLVCVAGFDPAASCSRSRRSSRLSYTQILAICTGLEPVSPHGQCGSLTRCFADPELVRLVRLERTLHGFSNRSLCHWGTSAWRTTTVTIRVLRFKRPPHHLNACGPMLVIYGEPRWFRSTWRRVKSPLLLHSGLSLGVRGPSAR